MAVVKADLPLLAHGQQINDCDQDQEYGNQIPQHQSGCCEH
jgi:hypothetical protein